MGGRHKTVFVKRKSNLSWAICSTLLCICFPIGLVAIFVALRAKKAWKEDRPETAGDMADMAKTIALIGILCSVIVFCAVVALLASGYFFRGLHHFGLMNEDTLQNLLQKQGEDIVDVHKENNDFYYINDVDYENVPVTDSQ